MYGFYLHKRSNLTAGLLISMIAISMLVATIPLTTTRMKPVEISFAKISPTLFEKIITQKETINVLIETYTNDYASIVADITQLGGTVNFKYKYINALAASVQANKITELTDNINVQKIYLDELVVPSSLPEQTPYAESLDSLLKTPIDLSMNNYQTTTLTPEQIASIEPTTYWNYKAMDAVGVWEAGYEGQGSLAAIIDTGIWSEHFMLVGSVIDGIDMSPDVGTPWEGYDKVTNHWHGSHVAGIFAGNGSILLDPDHLLVQSIELYTNETLPLDPTGEYKVVPLLGIAPAAQIYVIKVFPHTGAGVYEWRIIAAIEHAIELKLNETYDIDIISMSLGGPTLFDGRDLLDQTVDKATSVGITVVSAAGNAGPAAMTVASPGSANAGITAAAAAHPVNTRVFWDYYYGEFGIGYKLYKTDSPQIYAFSSRGPTSDGRGKPDVSATGIFVLSAYPTMDNPDGLAFASGTSMATPAVSGGIALINSYAEENVPDATPEDYKQAVKKGAVWLDGYTEYDQGTGYLNAANALSAFMEDPHYGDKASKLPKKARLADITNIPIVGSGEYTAPIENLAPGYKVGFIFEITEETDSIRLGVTNVYLGEDNPLDINSFEIYIQSAKRTFYGYYIDSANVWGDATFYITDDETTWSGEVTGVFKDRYTRVIEPGYMKIVIENDWTSYDMVSATITITVTETTPPEPDWSTSGVISHDEVIPWFEIPVPTGTQKAIVELWWVNDWTRYPTSDLDMYINFGGIDGPYNYDGVTLNSPERAVLERPSFIKVMIHAYEINTGEPEPWELRVWFL